MMLDAGCWFSKFEVASLERLITPWRDEKGKIPI
jgi:hypothetical protein